MPTPVATRRFKKQKKAAFPDQSLFHLEGTWTTQAKEQATLQSFANKPSLATMFFASCAYACPILIEDIKSLLNEIPEEQRDQLNVLMFSFDSERDHPETLAEFAEQRGLTTPPWTLMHSDGDTILETAAALGVRYRQDEQGNFAHSNIMTLLNAEGEIVYQLNGLRADPAPMVNAIKKLLDPAGK